MRQTLFLSSIKDLRLKKKYVYFSILYGLSSLVVPFATQYLVNSLSLAGILVNTLTFSLVLGFALCISQIFKFCQVILNEYLQRELYLNEVQNWSNGDLKDEAPYFFEIMSLMKSFSGSFSHLIELMLLLFFGLITIIFFHPVFIFLALLIGSVIWLMFSSWKAAVDTSVAESNAKYGLYYEIEAGVKLEAPQIDRFLEKRDLHFYFIKKNKLYVGVTFVLAHLILFGSGIYFIQQQQLSIGQLVSSEIILAGILASFTRLPKTLESMFDFETSKIKIRQAIEQKGSHE